MKNACQWALAVVMTVTQSPLHAESAKQKSGGGGAKNRQAKGLTAAQALKKVSLLPEVRAWKSSIEKAATKARPVKAHIELDREEAGAFVVHVFEEVPDDSETSHTATFNWYYVNARTGKVRKEF